MNKGFTLIEVLVVAVILAILSATAIPAMNGYIERTSDMVCQHTAAAVLKSVLVYIQNTGWNDSMIDSYELDELNAILGNYRIKVEGKYTVNVEINGPDEITVFVQDNQYAGWAELGS